MPYVGDNRITTAAFFVNGVAADPTTVTLKFQFGGPSAADTTWVYGSSGIVRLGVGLYQATVPASAAGGAIYQWVGTGNAQASSVTTEDISPLPLT